MARYSRNKYEASDTGLIRRRGGAIGGSAPPVREGLFRFLKSEDVPPSNSRHLRFDSLSIASDGMIPP